MELKLFQIKLSKIRPPNYGILTSLIMHLMRYIVITPINKLSYLNAALIDVQFGPCIERFGMFFLHDIDLDNGVILPCLEDEDDEEVKKVMKVEQKRKRKARAAPRIVNSEPSATYPYGDAPSWATIAQAVQEAPEVIMKTWVWDPEWDCYHHASNLFIQMTVNLWLTVADKQLNGSAPRPTTLEDAMATWTITAVQSTLINSVFIPSNHGLKGCRTGRKQPSFSSLVDILFPPPDSRFNPKSTWLPFVEKGYINEYHQIFPNLSSHQRDRFKSNMADLLSEIQCFPPIVRCGEGSRQVGRIWKTSNGFVEIITNPLFYKVAQIGKPERVGKKVSTRVKASQNIIEARLDEVHRGIPFKTAKREIQNKQKAYRSWKKKNYRKPPQRKRMTLVESESESRESSSGEDSGEDEKPLTDNTDSSEEDSREDRPRSDSDSHRYNVESD